MHCPHISPGAVCMKDLQPSTMHIGDHIRSFFFFGAGTARYFFPGCGKQMSPIDASSGKTLNILGTRRDIRIYWWNKNNKNTYIPFLHCAHSCPLMETLVLWHVTHSWRRTPLLSMNDVGNVSCVSEAASSPDSFIIFMSTQKSLILKELNEFH